MTKSAYQLGHLMPLLLATLPLLGQTRAPVPAWSDRHSNELLEMRLVRANQRTAEPDPEGRDTAPWKGVISVTLKNISKQTVRYVRTSWTWDYRIDVIDPDGEPVAKTKEGASLPETDEERSGYPFMRVTMTLEPNQSASEPLFLSSLFELKPGIEYTIRIRRAVGLPLKDAYGNVLPDRELRASMVIPARN